MKVVSDASPLILFARADLLGVLYGLFNELVIPRIVRDEVTGNAKRPGAATILATSWITTTELDAEHQVKADLLGDLQLDRGEAAAIALGLQVGADLLLVDEERGRRTAMSLGLTVTGSIGLVLKAWRSALIPDPEDVLRRLIQEGLWLSPRLLRWFDDQVRSGP